MNSPLEGFSGDVADAIAMCSGSKYEGAAVEARTVCHRGVRLCGPAIRTKSFLSVLTKDRRTAILQ
jgi:hypothetical protein